MKARVVGLVSVVAIAVAGFALTAAPSAMAAPANDNFASAQVIGPALPVNVPASNVGATAEPAEQPIYSNAVSSSIWFKWTAPSAAKVVVDLCNNGFTGDEFPFEKFAVRTSFGQVVPVMEMAGECSARFTPVASTIYYIQVDYGNDQGTFNFKLRQLAPPANDNYASRQVIGPALPVTLNTTNADSAWEVNEPATLGGSTQSRSVWYSWTAPSTGRVALDVCESTGIVGAQNKQVVVFTGGPPITSLVQYAVPDSNCEINFLANAGVNYTIAFSGYISGEMNFVLKLVSAPPPTNDNFASAQVVGPGLPVSVTGNNDFATKEAGEPQHANAGPPYHSLWYSWTPAANARVRISACSKTFDAARVGVYTGATVNALTQVAELPGFSPHCRVTLNAVAGSIYRIAAAGGPQENAHGEFTLDVHAESLPGNDNFANAQVIGPTLPATINGTTVDATVEEDEPSTDPYGGDRNPSVWYRWTAPSDDAMIFTACSTGPETPVIATFSGSALGDLDHIDSDSSGCRDGSNGGRLAIAPVAGQTYYVLVESDNEDYDTPFTLSAIGLKEETITPPPSTFNLKKAIAKCKKIKGKGRKAKMKRANCIKQAKKKAAIIKCGKLTSASAEAKCIKAAKKKYR